jgi:hypothetical protein
LSVINQFRTLPRRKGLGILCILAIIALLIATLWPFDFFPSNKVNWLPDASGLRFRSTGVVLGNAPLRPASATSGGSSLELLVRPASVKSVVVILSFYTSDTRSQFAVRQYRDGLVVSRDFLNAQIDARSPELEANHMFEPGKLLLLTITSGINGTIVYKNGGQPRVFPRFKIMPGDLAGQIVLGTSALIDESYSGEIRGLAIYPKELTPAEVLRDYNDWTATPGSAADLATFRESIAQASIARYVFAERTGSTIHSAVPTAPDLEIPQRFVVPQKPFLESPSDEFVFSGAYVRDVVENIVGFAPLGFILCAYFACLRSPRQAILYATLAGGSLSFLIEVLQFYIPPRGSGITDVITNTLGAFFGAVVARPSMVVKILGSTKLIIE